MPFTNPILAGNSLARPVEKSPNYVTGVSGWAIFKDGSVEFNNGIFRGTISAGTFEGDDFIINPNGAFFYSGTPALGNLIFSITSATGSNVDQFGNVYFGPGSVAYGGAGLPYVVMSSNFEGAPGFALGSNRPMEAFAASLFSFITNQGLANEFLGIFVQGPSANSPNGSVVQVELFSAANDGSTTAQGSLDYVDNSNNDYTELVWGDGGLFLRYVEHLTAQDPTVTGVPTDETPKTMALASGFSLGAGNYATYQLTPDGRVSLDVFATVSSGPGITFKQFTSTALPPAYRPSVNRFGVLSANEMAVFTGSNNAGGLVQLATSGQIFVYGAAIAATSLYFNCDLRR